MKPEIDSGTDRNRRDAALQLLSQGLTVVPYVPPTAPIPEAGKRPLWPNYPGPIPDGLTERRILIEPGDIETLDWALSRSPHMNIAVLNVAQVDADDAESAEFAKSLGVTQEAPCWIVRTRRGYRAIYRNPERSDIWNLTKAGTCDRRRRSLANLESLPPGTPLCECDPLCAHELDLLIESPAILPPSVHPSGVPYTWAPNNNPDTIPFDELGHVPPLLLEWWANQVKPRKGPPLRSINQPRGFIDAVIGALQDDHRRPAREKPNGWYEPFFCPLPGNHKRGDRRPSFAINTESTWARCWSCGYSESLTELAKHLNVPYTYVRRQRSGVVSVKGAV